MDLRGKLAPSADKRHVTTPAAEVAFVDRNNQPALAVHKRTALDRDPAPIALSRDELRELSSSNSYAALTGVVQKLFDARSDYLEAARPIDAEHLTDNNSILGVAGLRKTGFFQYIRSLCGTLPMRAEDVERALSESFDAAFMNRNIQFDLAHLDSYHPYSDPFDQGVRILQELVPTGDMRDRLTRVLQQITDRKTVFGYAVAERDIESSTGLRLVDRGYGEEQAISVAQGASNPLLPQYVLINIGTPLPTSLPAELQAHAGKAVLRDGEQYYFDRTGEPVPPALLAYLVERPASRRLGLRLLEPNEQPRTGIPYDWNRNGGIEIDEISISWWGHCHVQALLELLCLSAGSAVTLYNEETGVERTFETDAINDLLFAIRDMSASQAEQPRFAAKRNDTTGGPFAADRAIFTLTDGRQLPFKLQVEELYDQHDPRKALNVDDVFSPTIIESGIRFGTNPSFLSMTDGDWANIDGNRKLTAAVEYVDVDENGDLRRMSQGIVIDPFNPSPEPILLGSERATAGHRPDITKYYFDQRSGSIVSRTFRPVASSTGPGFVMEPLTSYFEPVGQARNITLSRELTREGLIELHRFFLDAAREGISFTTEKDPGHMVWNYGTYGFKLDKLERDGDFVHYHLDVSTKGGSKSWDYIIREDQLGRPIEAHALSTPADFVWRTEAFTNVPTPDTLPLFTYGLDVLYASMAEPAKGQQFCLRDRSGQLWFYDTYEQLAEDIAWIKAGRPMRVQGVA